jgi:hypothetical protein
MHLLFYTWCVSEQPKANVQRYILLGELKVILVTQVMEVSIGLCTGSAGRKIPEKRSQPRDR